MDSTQFAWVYMVLHGKANVTKYYYGGYDVVDNNVPGDTAGYYIDYNNTFKQMIKNVGVDWNKTQAPGSDYHFEFAGTDCESDRKEFMTGKLVLKNGYVQTWIVDHNMEDLSRTVFDMMAKIDKLKAKYVEIFG